MSTHTPDLLYYRDIVSRLQDSASILDLGCCFGQDLRYMAADGAPTQNMYASDVTEDLWDIGFEMYRDTGRMKARFLIADILDPNSSHTELRGKIDVLLVNQVFHLFDWDKQIQAGKNMVSLSRPGTWLVGYHIGSVIGRAVPVKATTGGSTGSAGSNTRFLHSQDTWQDIWRHIGEETGTEWVVESSIHELKE